MRSDTLRFGYRCPRLGLTQIELRRKQVKGDVGALGLNSAGKEVAKRGNETVRVPRLRVEETKQRWAATCPTAMTTAHCRA